HTEWGVQARRGRRQKEGCPFFFRPRQKLAGWLLPKDAFRVGYSLLTGALVAGAVCLTSPSHSRSEGLPLLWREPTKLAFCSCNRARRWLTVHPSFAALGRRWPSSGRRREFSVHCCRQPADALTR